MIIRETRISDVGLKALGKALKELAHLQKIDLDFGG